MSDTNDRLGTMLVGHYRLERELGSGAMGVVYQAHDTRLDRPVAVKFLSPQAGSDPSDETLEPRFVAEARSVSSLDHPNVGAVYEIDRDDDGRLFIAMGSATRFTYPARCTNRFIAAIFKFYSGFLVRSHDRVRGNVHGKTRQLIVLPMLHLRPSKRD